MYKLLVQWSNYAELKLWKYIDSALIKERVTVKIYRYCKITKGLHNLLENIDEASIMKYEHKLIFISWLVDRVFFKQKLR